MPRKQAELSPLPGNPTEDLNVLARPTGLLHQGKWFDAEALAAMRQTSIDRADAQRSEVQIMSALKEQETLALP